MGKWITELKAKQVSETHWELIEPLIYRSDKYGFIISDQGSITNFATVPRLPLFYLVAGGKNNPPAALHDKSYEEKKLTRLQCDNMYFEAILDWIPKDGYSLKSIIMRILSYPLAALSWLFVRVFGWRYW